MDSSGLLFSAEVNDTAIRAVAANKRFIVICSEESNVRVFDVKGNPLQTLQTAQKTRNVAIYDRYLATGEKNGVGELFDLGAKKMPQLCTFQSKGKVSVTMYNVDICSQGVLLSSSRPYGMKADEKDKRLQVAHLFNLEGTILHSFQHGAMIGRMGICLSEEYCATSGEDQIVKIWSATTGELLLQLPSEKARSPGVRIKSHQLFVSGANDVSVYSLPQGTLERRLELEASPTSPTSPQSTNAAGTLRSTPMTYPRLALGGSYVVSASEMRVASVWTVLDGKILCTITDERRISGDFYAAVGGDRLALIAGKMLKIYDLTVHSGYKRTYSESLGMSLDYLIDPKQFTLVAQEATGEENPNFHQLAPKIAFGDAALGAQSVCPRDGRRGCALVDVLPSGPATHFLSWAWGYSLQTVVLALRNWSEESKIDAQQTFIWICFFCNNQERILKEKTKEGSDDLESTFQSRLQSIGRVLVLFDEWSKPAYLTRVWCIFETFVAAKASISYTLIFPPESSKSLHETLQRGMHLEVTKEWSSIDVAQARASRPVDEEKVKGLITRTSSFEEVNTVVKSHLVGWFKKQFEVIFEKGVQEGFSTSESCPHCAVKEDEIAALKAQLQDRDAEIARLKELLPAGSAAAVAHASAWRATSPDV